MNISQLPYMIAIASTGSLSGAARRVGVSQPAISKYLSELEREIGLKLFEADGKTLRPTEAGVLYLQAAQEILGLKQRTISSISALGRSVERELCIGMLPHPGEKLLAELFVEFNSRFPQIRLHPVEAERMALAEAVRTRELSFALADCPEALPEEVEYLPVFREELILAVPLTYPMAPENPLYQMENLPYADLQDFTSATFLQLEPGTPLYEAAEPLLKNVAPHRQRFFTAVNDDTLAVLIRDGAGIGLLPARYCREKSELAFFRLRQPVFLQGGIFLPRGSQLSDAERCLIYLLLKRQAEEQGVTIQWGKLLREIVRQFGTALDAVTHCMEGADEH